LISGTHFAHPPEKGGGYGFNSGFNVNSN